MTVVFNNRIGMILTGACPDGGRVQVELADGRVACRVAGSGDAGADQGQ